MYLLKDLNNSDAIIKNKNNNQYVKSIDHENKADIDPQRSTKDCLANQPDGNRHKCLASRSGIKTLKHGQQAQQNKQHSRQVLLNQ